MTGHLGDEGVGSVTVIKEECDSYAFLDLKPSCDQSTMPTPDPCGDDSKRSQNFFAVIPGSMREHQPSLGDSSETEKLLWKTIYEALTRIQALTILDWVYNVDE